MAITVRVDFSAWRAAIARLVREAPPAMVRAINRSVKSAEVVMVRSVAADLGLRQADIRADGDRAKSLVVVDHASLANLRGAVVATGRRVPLIKFNARDRRPRGVVARLRGGRGQYPEAFIRTMRSGHRGVFKRQRVARLPIVELHGPSVPIVFAKHLPAGEARALEQLAKNVNHELVRLVTT